MLDETNKDLEAQEAEKAKLEAKSEARPNDKNTNKLNDVKIRFLRQLN